MSGNDDRSQAATDKLKAAALSAAKGLSRAQAERAAAAATRNVNAYGQKEEGPSRWQERKEAKRQMYLMSTEKAVRLGVKPKASATSSSSLGSYTQCQKCFQPGHWTYECKNDRVYISRPSRTQQLKNPKLRKPADLVSYHFENPDLEKEREEEMKLMKEKLKKVKSEKSKSKSKSKSKRKHRSPSVSGSEASVFDSDTESSVSGSEYSSESSSSYSSSESEDKKRKHKSKQKKRRHRRDSSTSSASSASDSASDSDSDDKSRRKRSKRRSDRR